MQIKGIEHRNNLILDSISSDCLDFIQSKSLTKPILSGEVIHEPDAPLHSLVFPQDGLISLQYTTGEGRTVEKMSIGIDGVVGVDYLLGSDRLPGRAVTVISGRASWLPVRDFTQALEKFPCVRPVMSIYVNNQVKQLMQAVVCASVHTSTQRLSTWLLHADDRTQATRFDITQRMLADILGLRLATVSDGCSKLLTVGAINYSRGRLEITDRALLEERACECYEAVRLYGLPVSDND